MDQNTNSIKEIVNESPEKIPTIISLYEPIMGPNSTGFWIRFKDGIYHNTFCPGKELQQNDFEESLKNGEAIVSSYKPFSKDFLLLIFPEEENKSEYEKILKLYE